MKKPYELTLDLQLFAEETGVESVPAAEEQIPAPPENNESDPETGVEEQAAAEPKEKENNFEKAFAKRLAAEREKWEKERQAELEKYKDHDIARKALDFLMKQNNISDPMTLKEQLELAELQERAEKENLPPEVLKRLDELEKKAAKVDEIEKQQQEAQQTQQFEQTLKEFCEGKQLDGKPLDYKELWKYMYENKTENPEIAFKAMKADILEKQLEQAEKEGMKKLIEAKTNIPKVDGARGTGAVAPNPPKTFAEARERALQRDYFK